MKAVGILMVCAVLTLGIRLGADSVLFKDTFNTSIDTYTISYGYVARQAGGSITAQYLEDAHTGSGGANDSLTKTSNWGGAEPSRSLYIGSGSTWSGNIYNWAAPNYNYSAPSKFEVSVNLKSRNTNVAQSDKYMGVLLGSDSTGQFIDASDSGVGFVYTGNVTASDEGEPTWRVLDKGLVVASGYSDVTATVFQPLLIYVDNSGTTAKLDMWFGGEHILSRHPYSGGRFTNNWITLGSYDGRTSSGNYTWGEFDDLTVTTRTSIGSGGNGLAGFVDLGGYVGDASMIAVRIDFLQGGSVVRRETPFLDKFGYYSISDVPAGTYNASFKVSHSLSKEVTGVTVPGGCDVLLINGDSDGDNRISTTDLSIELKH